MTNRVTKEKRFKDGRAVVYIRGKIIYYLLDPKVLPKSLW